MKKAKLHKRQIFYMVMYLILIALSITFFTVIFFFPNVAVQSITGIVFLLWLPLAFATILTDIPQTVAGNIFMYRRIYNKDKRDYKLKTYSSDEFAESEFYQFLMNDSPYSKIRKIKVDRETKKEKKGHYFLVFLKNAEKYRVSVVKRDKKTMQRYTTKWIVNSVEEVK